MEIKKWTHMITLSKQMMEIIFAKFLKRNSIVMKCFVQIKGKSAVESHQNRKCWF